MSTLDADLTARACVRKLANSLFAIHDAIANLVGTVAARKGIVVVFLNYPRQLG